VSQVSDRRSFLAAATWVVCALQAARSCIAQIGSETLLRVRLCCWIASVFVYPKHPRRAEKESCVGVCPCSETQDIQRQEGNLSATLTCGVRTYGPVSSAAVAHRKGTNHRPAIAYRADALLPGAAAPEHVGLRCLPLHTIATTIVFLASASALAFSLPQVACRDAELTGHEHTM
jgi:hypothetical protein